MLQVTHRRLRTLNEWNSLGYKINKGAKHVKRNNSGQCIFSSKQVSKRKEWHPYDHGDGDLEDPLYCGMTEEEFLGYLPGDQE